MKHNSLDFGKSQTEYGLNLFILGFILMSILAVVAQGMRELNKGSYIEKESTIYQIQNSPEVGN